MKNQDIIHTFYTAFSNGDSETMKKCYHPDIEFSDPAFGTLEGERAGLMWEMLLSSKQSELKINFDNIQADDREGSAHWTAEYKYGKGKRTVVNHVTAQFKFKDGKIIEHKDVFNLWKWTQQAIGTAGYLLGWTSFMRNKIHQTTNSRLDKYIAKKDTKKTDL